jgi:hypothetical protein
MSLSNQDVGVRVSCYPRQGDARGSRLKGTVQDVRDPHDTEGVRCTYIGHVWDYCSRGYSTRGSP